MFLPNIYNLVSIAFLLVVTSNLLASQNLPQPAKRIVDRPESVFVEFGRLADRTKPLNLGQGYPDFAAYQYLVDQLPVVINQSDPKNWPNHQYTSSYGNPELTKALVKYFNQYESFEYLNNPNDEVVVGVGSTEVLTSAVLSFVNPGDEVLVVEPSWDAYIAMVYQAQAKSVSLPLRLAKEYQSSASNISSEHYSIDMGEFRSKITPKTRMLILNTPNNPLGKMYSLNELKEIAKICTEFNILVLADEVYEHLHYDNFTHLSIAHLPGMWNRTITVGSAGKTFSATGWKIGWGLGPKHLIRYVQLMHQVIVGEVATHLQVAVARTFEHEMSLIKSGKPFYWQHLRADSAQKRDRMAAILARVNMRAIIPQGGYFMLVDFSDLAKHYPQYQSEGQMEGKINSNDYRFARWLSLAKKLQAIPASAFYFDNKLSATNMLRFCFVKQTKTIDKLEEIVAGLRRDLG